MSKIVIHTDGTREPFEINKLIAAITNLVNSVTTGEEAGVAMFRIMKNVELKLPDEVSSQELDTIILKATEMLISTDILYDAIAARQLIKITNRQISHRFASFQEYITYCVDNKLLDTRLGDFDFMYLEQHFKPENDNIFNFFGIATIVDRYLMKDREKVLIEKPQWFWMRVAMGLSLNESDKESFAVSVYEKLSAMKYIHSTPTLYNSGSPFSQFSSCYINVVGDSMDEIMDKVNETAQFAKFAGGVGTSITKLRSSGSHIHSINAKSSGPIPFIKIFDSVINGVVQWGKRRASQVMYMEPRHYNIYEFLDLKETNGSPYLRTPSLNTAIWTPDCFMERVESGQDRWLLDPHECPELTTTRGEEFTRYYNDYCDKAERGEIKAARKVKARELYDRILFQLAKTGNYWVNFKDTHNRYNQAPSYGVIHSSNLCTEISIPNREDSTAVCTLASIVLPAYIDKDKVLHEDISALTVEERLWLIDWDSMKETIHIAVQALDNAMELNYYPSEASRKNTMDLRPIGLGIMGFADVCVLLGVAFDSPEAVRIADKIWEFLKEQALAKSQELAASRWAFGDYNETTYTYPARRNALLMAIAPTASISLIAGSSSTVDPYFSNLYSRETMGGKFTIVNEMLVKQCKAKGIWSEHLKNKIIGYNGSVMNIQELDGHIDKNLYKTAYETDRKAQIDIAAAFQKHIDQAISRNMYLEEKDRANMYDVYMYAWKKQIKGTYYCFIEKKLQGEKYTQTVNKSEGRVGFGARTATATSPSESSAPRMGFGARVTPVVATATVTVVEDTTDVDSSSSEVLHGWLTREQIREKLIAEKWEEHVTKLEAGELYNGNCPLDPFEKVMCTSCQ